MADETQEDREGQERIRANIRSKVYAATESAIDEKIETEKDAIRKGDGSFFGWIKGLIFQLAEFLGVEKWLANLVGTPIPEQQERTALSSHIADTVSRTLTDEKFQYKNRQEFEAGLTGRMFADLKNHASEMPSFSEDQLLTAASQAAANVSKEFSGLFDASGNAVGNPLVQSSAVNRMAEQQFSEALQSMNDKEKKDLAQLADKKLAQSDLNHIAHILAPKLAELHGGRLDELKSQGEGAFITVSDEVRKTLVANRGLINSGGMNFDEAGLGVLADEVAKGFIKERIGIDKPPQAFTTAAEERKQKAINNRVTGKVETLVAESIKSNTAVATVAAFHSSFWKSIPIPNAPVAVMHKYYYYNAPNDGTKAEHYYRNDIPDQNGELKNAENELYQFAVGKNTSLNDAQRKQAAKIVAGAVTKTLNDPDGRKLGDTEEDKQKLAAALKNNIRGALEENKSRLDALGPDNKIDTINKALGFDLFTQVSEGIAKTVTENKNNEYKMLAEAQNLLIDSKLAALSKDATILAGVTGGTEQAGDAPAQGGSKKRGTGRG